MIVLAPVGIGLILSVLWDAFETMVLPRRVDRRFRLSRVFLRGLWYPWRAASRGISRAAAREWLLGVFGPISILLLFIFWAALLIFGFALIYASPGVDVFVGGHRANFGTAMYMSGTSFVTLGLGDVAPTTGAARAATVIEAGTGFGFLALVIGYLPVLYQSFSRRELNISLLDARAGSPPSAGEMLRRYGASNDTAELERLLLEWERWSADLLESHLSYPVLAYFRSQHDHQSWLSALTAILDFSALILACERDNRLRRPAELAFAMSRHAVVDLTQNFGLELHDPDPQRLSSADAARLNPLLELARLTTLDAPASRERLSEFQAMYEPYVDAMAMFFGMELPPWLAGRQLDDWQTSDRSTVLPNTP
ncbi:MAG TPA: potassium channel family protein [Dehalococcoidia bacterium]|nr:potassium channel family protein [Dehalococcoidia bacterium]